MDILAEGMAMAFCARCGASLSGNPPFCLSCATPVMNAVMSAVPRAAVAVREPESADTGSNVAAALAYLVGFISASLFSGLSATSRIHLSAFTPFSRSS